MKMKNFHWLVLGSLLIGVTRSPRRRSTREKPSASSSARRRETSTILGAADRRAHGQTYSRQSRFHRAEHARRGPCRRGQSPLHQAKPDGLTIIGSVIPSLYLNQLLGRSEIQFDWAKFTWIGSPARGDSQMYMRADSPYKTIEDVRTAKEPPKCGATGVTGPDSYLPKLLQDTVGAKFNIVTGYPGGTDIDLGVERGEIHCRAFTIEAFFGREPYHTWRKNNFVHHLFQTGRKRDARLPQIPTIFETHGSIQNSRVGARLSNVLLGADDMGRPMFGPPGMPADRLKILRDAFVKTMNDEQFRAEVKKRNYEFDPVGGEELQALAKELTSQPPEVIDRLKKVLGK